MKPVLTLIILISFVFSFSSVLSFADEAALSISKTEFVEGEPIYVTARSTSDKDWVGVVPLRDGKPVISAGSIIWAYIRTTNGSGASAGAGDGVAFDIRKGKTKSASTYENIAKAAGISADNLGSLPAGDYAVCLVPKDQDIKYGCTEFIPFTVVKADPSVTTDPEYAERIKPVAPASVAYEPDDPSSFYATGTVTVTPSDKNTAENTTDYIIYWGSKGKPLKGYTSLGMFRFRAGATSEFRIPRYVFIPDGADSILCCGYNRTTLTKSDEFASVPVSPGAPDPRDTDEPVAVYGIVSDVHINGGQTHADHAASMFSLCVKNEVSRLFVVGDIADHGAEGEYRQFFEIARRNGFSDDRIHLALDNHDTRDGTSTYGTDYGAVVGKFLKYVNVPEGQEKPADRLYYDFRADGYHFVFLASEKCGTHAYLSDAQLSWLEGVLGDEPDNKPVFVFIHQSLYDTVAGGLRVDGQDQKWNGIIAGDDALAKYGYVRPTSSNYKAMEKKLRDILEKHPEVMMFSGHSHWTMDSDSNMRPEDEKLPWLFNTAAVGYLWTSYDVVTGENLDGSQGYMVGVWNDCVIIAGFDFVTGEVVPAAFYCIMLASAADEVTEKTETSGTEAPGTSPSDSETVSAGSPGKRGCGALSSAAAGAAVCTLLCLRRRKEY